MRYGTVCSGIECFSLAVAARGWEPAWFAEIEPYCCDLLKERYPHVPNLGDITKIKAVSRCEVVVAGTPCQSFSVNAEQRGLDDARGQLALRFAEIIKQARPRWVVWENVPGVLTSGGGRDFGVFLNTLGQCGYGVAYRVLDSRFFGVAQRRRRVFVVGHYRDWRRAAAVLFDGPQYRADEVENREALQRGQERTVPRSVLGWTGDETPKYGVEIVPTLRSGQGGEGAGLSDGRGVLRRLTIKEWERLQGIPDGYTDIAGHGEHDRRKSVGNGFCVNVLRWIAKGIEAAEAAN